MWKDFKDRCAAVKKRMSLRAEERKALMLRGIELKRLKRIRRKKVPSYTYCKNCGTELKGMYCHRCGQYALDVEQPFWKYVLQYFENVYQFDSKVWATLWMLFRRPGFLTKEFNAGKIVSYVHPMRLLMFITVLFFFFFFIFVDRKIDDGLSTWKQEDPPLAEILDTLRNYSGVAYSEMVAWEKDSVVAVVADSAAIGRHPDFVEIIGCAPAAEGEEGHDTLTVRVSGMFVESFGLKPAGTFAGVMLYDCTGHDVTGEEAEQHAREALFKERALGYAGKYMPLLALLLVPFMAFMFKVLYRKIRLSYMYNFVFAIHLTCFVFILLAVYITVGELWHYGSLVSWAFALLVLAYTVMASHRVYEGTGWVKAVLKSVLLWSAYLFVLLAVLCSFTLLVVYNLNEEMQNVFL